VFILILTDDDVDCHGFLHLVQAFAVSIRHGRGSVYPWAAPAV
jgi:hypothetical protein